MYCLDCTCDILKPLASSPSPSAPVHEVIKMPLDEVMRDQITVYSAHRTAWNLEHVIQQTQFATFVGVNGDACHPGLSVDKREVHSK